MKQTYNFKPAWWLPGGHLQTLWSTLIKRKVDIPLTPERLVLPDGDFLDLDWASGHHTGPLALVLHGLEGSIKSSYAKGMVKALSHAGFRAVCMHFRGCSGEHNKNARSYHAGGTADLAYVLQTLRAREPSTPISVVGFSLGGNVVLKYLGETQLNNPVSCAVAISVPFLLNRCTDRLKKGFSRLYQKHLLTALRRKLIDKAKYVDFPISLDNIDKIKDIEEFDDVITAKLYGFKDVKDYYNQSSSLHYLSKIKTPTLLLQARNDPFIYADAIPHQADLPTHVSLEVHPNGGHVGFIGGSLPWQPKYWLEERVPSYIHNHLKVR